MLHPFPDSLYPGISTEPDPSLASLAELPAKGKQELVDDDGDDEYKDEPDAEVDVNMDDILDKPPASAELQDGAGDDWIEDDGQKFHKASLLCIRSILSGTLCILPAGGTLTDSIINEM
ncbi:hypothetical protein PILCRDRAFT_8651 [Piloderma croceum F 1598]|uniref:Uncharacterized protein n=1 Tax=Piloderma croceum (strain F 1598) TaxID=765440 RepID=A0A0C3FAI7_PILCF|nr:hypothetical protein PILCRDRAFT_8651 [Piloderma croceum F 1598]